MGCYCTGWRLYPLSEAYVNECGPTVGRGARTVSAQIHEAHEPGWLKPVVSVRNQSGFVISTVYGRPERGLAAAKRQGNEMLDDECRMRGLSGLRSRRRRRR